MYDLLQDNLFDLAGRIFIQTDIIRLTAAITADNFHLLPYMYV